MFGKLFVGEYHTACGPCGFISPWSVRFNYRSHRRTDCVRKANGASQFKVGDSARTRDDQSEEEIAGREIKNGEVKRIQGTRLTSAPQREK